MPPTARPQVCAPQLNHGDLVVLESVQSATAYVVQLADAQARTPALLYLSDASAGRAAEHGACLEVVQQGEWFGLRSPLLDGVFLQARKKAPHLVFFSARLGVWEQWKVEALYQGVLQQHSPALCLTSRQVPTITLSVRAWRVGSTCGFSPPPASPPRTLQLDTGPGCTTDQRRPAAASGDAGAGAEYAESTTSSLQDDALELSHNVVKGYVTRVIKWPLFLAFRLWRAEVRAEHNRRADATAYHERRLQSVAWAALQQRTAEERHGRHLMVLAQQCWARQQARRLGRALQLWHGMAFRSSLLERLCRAHQRKDRWRRCAAVLAVWDRFTRERRALVHEYQKSRLRLAMLLARSILQAWMEVVAERRRIILAFQQRRLRLLLRTALTGWHAVASRLASARRAAAAVASAAISNARMDVLHAWRGWVERRRHLAQQHALLTAALTRRRLGSAWLAWRNLATDTAARKQHVQLLLALRRQQLAGCVLRRWLALVAEMAAVRSAAAQMAARRERSRLPNAFARWRVATGFLAAERSRSDPEAAARLLDVMQKRFAWERRRATARRVLTSWRRLAAEHMRLLLTAGVAARLKCRALAREVLSAWRGVLRRGEELGRELLARRQAALLRRAMRGWAGEAAGVRRLAVSAAVAERRLRGLRLRNVFAAWLDAARCSRVLWQRTVSAADNVLSRRVLDAWTRRCAAVRAALAALTRCRRGYEARLLAAALRGMAHRAGMQRSARHFRRRAAVALTARALQAWRRAAACSVRLKGIGRLLRGKWVRRLGHAVLRAWWAVAHAGALQVCLLDAMAAASWSGGGSQPSYADGLALARPAAYGYPGSPFKAGSAAAMRQAVQRGLPQGSTAPAPPPGEQYASTLRLLLASLGGVASAERGTRAASVSMVEALLARLPAMSRLAARPRRVALACFKAWRAHAAAKAKLRVATGRLQARRAAAAVTQCMHAWRETVATIRARRSAALTMGLRAAAALQRRCLLTWRQRAKRAARLRRTCLTILARRMARLRRAVLAAWGREVAEAKARQLEVRRVKADGRLALLGRAMRAWRGAVALLADMRAEAERQHTAHWRRTKRQVLTGWRQATEAAMQHLATCARLLQSRTKWRLLGLTLSAWHSFAQRERQRREDWPELCRAFFAWRSLVQPAGRAASAAHAKLEELGVDPVRPRRQASPKRQAVGPADDDEEEEEEQEEPQRERDASPAARPRAQRRARSRSPAPRAAMPAAGPRGGDGVPAAGRAGSTSSTASAMTTQTAPPPAAPAAAARTPARARTVGPTTVTAGSSSPSINTSPSSDGSRDGRSSPPVEELHLPGRGHDDDEDSGYPRHRRHDSALAAPAGMGMGMAGNPAFMWQQHWNSMMQAGGMGGLAGGAAPLPLPGGGWAQYPGGGGTVILAPAPQGATAAGGADSEALRERLAKLEETVKAQPATPASAAAASTPAAPAASRPPLMPSTSSRAMMASCKPEPGPMFQLKQQGGATAVGRASTASLSALAGAGDSGNSGVAATSAAAPQAPAQQTAAPAPAAPAPAPAAPTVHVVVHPYGPPPAEGSRPGSPAGSLPSWSRRTTAEQDSPFQDRRANARWRTVEDAESELPDLPRSQSPAPQPAPALPAPSGGSQPGPEIGAAAPAAPMAAVTGQARPSSAPPAPAGQPPRLQLAGAESQAVGGEEEPLPLSPVSTRRSSSLATDGGASRRPTSDQVTADGLDLPPQVRYQLGPPPKRVQPYGAWQATLAAQGSFQSQQGSDMPGSAAASRRGSEDGVITTVYSAGGLGMTAQWHPRQQQQQQQYAQRQQEQEPGAGMDGQSQELHRPTALRAPQGPSRLGNAALSYSASEGSRRLPGDDAGPAVFDFSSGRRSPSAGAIVQEPPDAPRWPWPAHWGQLPPPQPPQQLSLPPPQQQQQVQPQPHMQQGGQQQQSAYQAGFAPPPPPQAPCAPSAPQAPHVVVIQPAPAQAPPPPQQQAVRTLPPPPPQQQQPQGPPVVHQHWVDGRAVYMSQPGQPGQPGEATPQEAAARQQGGTQQRWLAIEELPSDAGEQGALQPRERPPTEEHHPGERHSRSGLAPGHGGHISSQQWQGGSLVQTEAAGAVVPGPGPGLAAGVSAAEPQQAPPMQQVPQASGPVHHAQPSTHGPTYPVHQAVGAEAAGSERPGAVVVGGWPLPHPAQPGPGSVAMPHPVAPGAAPPHGSPNNAMTMAVGVPVGSELSFAGSPRSPTRHQGAAPGTAVQGWPAPQPPHPAQAPYGTAVPPGVPASGAPVSAAAGLPHGGPASPIAYRHGDTQVYGYAPALAPAEGVPAAAVPVAYGSPSSPTVHYQAGGWPAPAGQPSYHGGTLAPLQPGSAMLHPQPFMHAPQVPGAAPPPLQHSAPQPMLSGPQTAAGMPHPATGLMYTTTGVLQSAAGAAQPAPYPTATVSQPASGASYPASSMAQPTLVVLQAPYGVPPPQPTAVHPLAGAAPPQLAPTAPPLPPPAPWSQPSAAQGQQPGQPSAGNLPPHPGPPPAVQSSSDGEGRVVRRQLQPAAVAATPGAGPGSTAGSSRPGSRSASPSRSIEHADHAAQTGELPPSTSAAVLAGIAAAAAAVMTVGSASAAGAAPPPPPPAVATATVGTSMESTSARTSASGDAAGPAAVAARPAPAPAPTAPASVHAAVPRPVRPSTQPTTATPATLAPVAPDMAELDALLGQLEARSRSALRQRASGAANAGGGAGRPPHAPHPQTVSAGGGGADGASAAAAGLRGLDSIDSLRVRATTLSAPGAPIFGHPSGTAAAAQADAASAWGGAKPFTPTAAEAVGQDAEGGEVGEGTGGEGPPGRGELADAALRRLEAASVHAQVAAAAWSAANAAAAEAEAGAAASAVQGEQEREASRLAAAVEAAAAAATAAAAGAAAQRARPAAVGGGGGAGRVPAVERRPAARQPTGVAGGGPGGGGRKPVAAAELLSTFLPGAEDLVRRQAHAGPAAAAAQGRGQAQRAGQDPRPPWGQGATGRQAPAGGAPGAQGPSRNAQVQQQPRNAQSQQQQQQRRSAQHAQQVVQPQQAQQRQRPGAPVAAPPAARAAPAASHCDDAGLCPTCGSPTRPQRVSPPRQPPQRTAPPAPQRMQQELQAWQHSHADAGYQYMDGRADARHVRWSANGAAAAPMAFDADDGRGAAADAVHYRAGSYAGYESRYGGLDSRAGSMPGSADLMASDPLADLAALAQRRGNSQLAATLSELSHGGAQGASQGGWSQSSAPGAAEPPFHRAVPFPGPYVAPRGTYAVPPRQPAWAGAMASPPSSPPRRHMHGTTGAAPGAAHLAAAFGGPAPPQPRCRTPPRRTTSSSSACLPSREDSLASTATATTTTTSSSTRTAASDADAIVAAAAEVRGAGFDPDPLHSPLRGVLGQCRRLQAVAALREAEGDEVIRGVVAELSPRSAVAAALSAVMQGTQAPQGQSAGQGTVLRGTGQGPGSGVGILLDGRRLLAPGGRRV